MLAEHKSLRCPQGATKQVGGKMGQRLSWQAPGSCVSVSNTPVLLEITAFSKVSLRKWNLTMTKVEVSMYLLSSSPKLGFLLTPHTQQKHNIEMFMHRDTTVFYAFF